MTNFYRAYKHPLAAIAVLILCGGFLSFRQVKSGLFPDISFQKIKVIADAGQQPVDRMMTRVTVPLENAIKRTEGLDYIRSTTSRGSCEISVFLKSSVDVDRARQQIESFLNDAQASLPAGTNTTVQKMNPSILPVMGFSVEGPYSQIELRKIAVTIIKPHLAAVRGVSEIAVSGGKTKEFQIVVQPYKLSTLGISPSLIQTAVEQSNIFQSNGYISDHDRLYLTLTDNAVDNVRELRNLVIQNTPNRLIRLSDVADVVVEETKEYVRIKANGQDVPLIAVMKQAESNLLEVSDAIDARIADIGKILPKGIRVVPYYKQAEFVRESIVSLRDVLWIGMILAILVIVVFLRNIASSVVMLTAVPLTLSLTLIVLHAIGYTLNIMTLGAVAAAIGLVIDDAVIVVEQIHRSHEESPHASMRSIIGDAIHYLLPAMVGSSLSTIVIFAPFILMSGVAGAYFKIMAYTMMITLAASFVVSWILVPAMFLIFPDSGHSKAGVQRQARRWIHFVVHKPLISVGLIAVLVFSIVVLTPRIPTGFLPEMDEGSIVLDYTSPPGTTLEQTDALLQQVDAIIQKQPEVQTYSRRLGTQMGFFITEPNYGDYLIQLKTDRKARTEDVIERIRKEVHSVVPQFKIDCGQVIGDMLGDLMTSVQPIEVKVFGDDRITLNELSKEIAHHVSEVPGTDDVFDGVVIAGPEVNIQPDVPKLAQLGLSPSDFHFQLQTQIEGTVISSVLEKEQVINIRIIYPDALRTTIHSLSNCSLLLPGGLMKPLSTVAAISIEPGVAEIKRENQKMMGVVTARLADRDLGSTLKEIKSTLSRLPLPSGYHIEYGGSYADQQTAFTELLIILISASLLVFTVILFLFRELRVAFLVVGISILGIAGSILALTACGQSLNVGSYMGIIMVVGIVGENAIFTLHLYRSARLRSSASDSVTFAIATRLRPKLMTAFCSVIALLPLAMGIGSGAQLHQPLAIAVIGGLLIALPLLLVVLPTAMLYLNVLMPPEDEHVSDTAL